MFKGHVARVEHRKEGGRAGWRFCAVFVEVRFENHFDRRPHDALAAGHAAFFESQAGADRRGEAVVFAQGRPLRQRSVDGAMGLVVAWPTKGRVGLQALGNSKGSMRGGKRAFH